MKKIYALASLFMPLLMLGQSNKLIRQALRAEDPNEKIELFNQAIEEDPKNLDAYFYRALTKNEIGDYHGAILDYTKIIFYNPDADSYYNRGNCKFNLEDFEGASEDYEKAIEIDPELWDAVYNLGQAKFYLGDYAAAISNFSKILKVFPEDSKSRIQRALAHFEVKNYKEAFIDFGNNININPDTHAYSIRGKALLDINYYKEAQSDFFKALRLDNNNIPCYFYLGATHLFLGEFMPAINSFSESIKYDSLDYDAHLGLAMAQLKANDKASAKENFNKAKSIISADSTQYDGIEVFKSTYWYKNQNLFFKGIFEELNAL